MSDTEEILAVVERLGTTHADKIVARFLHANPHWRGADAADILEALADHDSDLDRLEPFYDEYPEMIELPGARYATRALIWGGYALTPDAVRHLTGAS